jgi:hypothetical protein
VKTALHSSPTPSVISRRSPSCFSRRP